MIKTSVFSFLTMILFGMQVSAACGDMSPRMFKGDTAVSLAYILKNSPFAHKTTVGDEITWTVHKVQCVQTNRGVTADLMPAYKCKPPSAVGPITAKSLFDAMSEMGVMPDGATGHVYESAQDMKCVLNKNGDGGMDVNPTCTFTAAWGDECS